MQKPIKIISLDTETYGMTGDLKRIAVYDGVEVTYGYSFSDIEPVLLNYNYLGFDVHVYIHNLEFDARKIPDIFSKERIVWKKSLTINGKLGVIADKLYTFHDSFKILPMGLKKLSEDFDLEHGKLDLWDEIINKYGTKKFKDIGDYFIRCDKDDELYVKYLGYDVMSLYELIMKLIDLTGIPEHDFVKKVSTASISRYLFQNGYKGKKFKDAKLLKTDYEILTLYNWKNSQEIEDFLRDSYCGGRTEVFKPILRGVRGYHYDVNSLYPYVMSYGVALYPVGKPIYRMDGKIAKHYFDDWLKNKIGLGFLECKVFIPKQNVPPLPVKKEKLIFPCGEVCGVWTYEELEYAIKYCGVKILDYYGVVHFEKTYPVFKRFVECFYELKNEGKKTKNDALTAFAKLILNVAYGYTGMRRDDKCSLDSLDNLEKHPDWTNLSETFGFVEYPTNVNAPYIQVQIASYVTSRARLVLLKGLKHIEEKGGNVYYCDTDSIVSDIPMDKKYIDKYKLGYWDCEADNIVEAVFLKPKVYIEKISKDKKIKINKKFKGITKDTVKDFDYSYYKFLLKLLKERKEKEYIVEKNRVVLRSLVYMQKKELDYDYYEVRDKKMNLQKLDKRHMYYNDNYTKPLYFESEKEFLDFSFNNYEDISFSLRGTK